MRLAGYSHIRPETIDAHDRVPVPDGGASAR
jgi:hypothetical protein